MEVIPCKVRGQLRWKIETFTGQKRRRQFFKTEAAAIEGLKAAQKDIAALGKAWVTLSPRERADIMSIVTEIANEGRSLREVWETAKNAKPHAEQVCTLDNALTAFLAEKRKANRRSKYVSTLEWYLGKFITGRGSLEVSAIGEPHIKSWFETRKESPIGQKTSMALLSTFFSWCWRKHYISENPIRRMEKISVDRNAPATLSNLQCRKALAWCIRHEPNLLAWLTLTLFCGLRPDAEADFVTWSAIDLARGRVILNRSKIRSHHRILELKFCPPALPWLKLAKELQSTLPLTHVTRRRYIRKLRSFLKLKRWPQDILRHTAASNLLAFHQDAGKVSAFLANSAGILLRDYKALVFKEDAERFMKLLPKKRHHPKTNSGKTP